jgi:hypothetical protein
MDVLTQNEQIFKSIKDGNVSIKALHEYFASMRGPKVQIVKTSTAEYHFINPRAYYSKSELIKTVGSLLCSGYKLMPNPNSPLIVCERIN